MELLGYSERGVINALFYSIKYSPDSLILIVKLLEKVIFPYTTKTFTPIINATILIEQSFSDFGDADVLLLIDTEKEKKAIFIEAKVKTNWKIHKKYDKFVIGTQGEIPISNIFTQLYRKNRLINGLKKSGIEGLKEGLRFSLSSKKQLRKIGSNSVVLKSVQLLQNYLDDVSFLAIVPDTLRNLDHFFSEYIFTKKPFDLPEWDTCNFGYLTWAMIEDYCLKNDLESALDVFKHNEGGIY
jgi:hypothetical protein